MANGTLTPARIAMLLEEEEKAKVAKPAPSVAMPHDAIGSAQPLTLNSPTQEIDDPEAAARAAAKAERHRLRRLQREQEQRSQGGLDELAILDAQSATPKVKGRVLLCCRGVLVFPYLTTRLALVHHDFGDVPLQASNTKGFKSAQLNVADFGGDELAMLEAQSSFGGGGDTSGFTSKYAASPPEEDLSAEELYGALKPRQPKFKPGR
jgi:hypothetical protein